jgi:hypothetical protein
MEKSTDNIITCQTKFKAKPNAELTKENFTSCDRCKITEENCREAINQIKNYVDSINERINMMYHKIGPISNDEMNYSRCLNYYHTIYYTELEKFKIGSDVISSMRNLMKSIRLFNDKVDYIQNKCENFEKLVHEAKKSYKFAVKDDMKGFPIIPEMEVNDVKNIDVQSIFKNFNNAKDSFEATIKDLKSNFTVNNSSNCVLESLENININNNNNNLPYNNNSVTNSSNDLKLIDCSKESFLKNELYRLIKENTSLRV